MAFKLEINPTFREMNGRFTRANKNLLEDRRDLVRTEGRRLVRITRKEIDDSTSGSGKFAQGVRFRTFNRGDQIGLTLSVPQPLGRFLLEGTKPHRIVAVNARALRFTSGSGTVVMVPRNPSYARSHFRDGVLWSAKGYVDHPGTKANPFIERAKDKWLPGALVSIRRIATRWATTVTIK